MAGIGGSANAAFYGDGIGHARNPGRQNLGSLTMGTDASGADQGLADTSARWAATTPHAVLASTVGAGSDDSSFERLQRDSGGYAPGSMGQFQDQLDQGTDDNTP